MLRIILAALSLLICMNAKAQVYYCSAHDNEVTFGKENSSRVAYALANDHKYIGVLLLTEPSKSKSLVSAIDADDGYIRFHNDDLDLVSAVLPIDRALSFTNCNTTVAIFFEQPDAAYSRGAGGLEVINLEQRLRWYRELSENHSEISNANARGFEPLHEPLLDPYDIRDDLNANNLDPFDEQLDGRGIVIAQVENLPDVLLPELQYAIDKTGKPIPKFRAIHGWPEDAYDPFTGEQKTDQSRWIQLGSEKPHDFTVSTEALHKLGGMESEFLFGEFKIPQAVLPRSLDLSQSHGEENGHPLSIRVVVSIGSGMVGADTNDDGFLAENELFRLYNRAGAFGTLGRDNPTTPVRESVGFAFQLRGDSLGIHFGTGGHATMVSGAMSANKNIDGRVDGVAPGAQISVFDKGASASNFARALIAAYCDSSVDLVQIQGSQSVTYNHDLKDGSSLFSLLIGRLFTLCEKPAFFTATNRPGLSSAADLGNSDAVISVGAYQSSSSVHANRLLVIPNDDNLHWNGAEGPNGLGGPNPDVMAPANPISLEPGYSFGNQDALDGAIELPPGYGIAAGTSTAAPVAAGAAALLLDGLNRHRICWNTSNLYRAIHHGARFLPDLEAYRQGRGLFDVRASWDLIKNHGCSSQEELRIRAPLATEFVSLGLTPEVGEGLFIAEGVYVGNQYDWNASLSLHGSDVDDMLVEVVVHGNNNELYSFPQELHLSASKAKLPIRFSALKTGAHSVLVEFIRKKGQVSLGQMMATVIVPNVDLTHTHYSTEKIEMISPYRENYYFYVPDDVELLEVGLRFPVARRWMDIFVHGPGSKQGQQTIRLWPDGNGESFVSIARPLEGIWELSFVDAGDLFDFDWSLFPHFNSSTYPINVSLQIYHSDHGQAENGSQSADGSISPTSVRRQVFYGSAETHEIQVSSEPYKTYKFETNSSELVAFELEGSMDNAGDIDLHLFRCRDGSCASVAASKRYFSDELITLYQPENGSWKIVAINAGDPSGSANPIELFSLNMAQNEPSEPEPINSLRPILANECDSNSNDPCEAPHTTLVFACGLETTFVRRGPRPCLTNRYMTRPRLIEIVTAEERIAQ